MKLWLKIMLGGVTAAAAVVTALIRLRRKEAY